MILIPPNPGRTATLLPREKLLFVVLAAGIGLRVLAPLRAYPRQNSQSKKDPSFRLFRSANGIWDFFWEVLCQAKVIRERPLPGLAHAFVFWAFCAFALVTLNHCAAGFGLGFLDPAGWFGRSTSTLPPLRAGLRGRHPGPLCPPFSGAAQMARREALLGIGPDCAADLRPDGHLSGLVLRRRRRPCVAVQELWWAHTLTLLAFCRSFRTPSTCTWC
jgi:hypothetical protein